MKFKSFLKPVKILPRFPSFRICPNAKYENSEISEISLTYLFAIKQSRKPWKQLLPLWVTVIYKIQIISEAEKSLSEISEFSNLP